MQGRKMSQGTSSHREYRFFSGDEERGQQEKVRGSPRREEWMSMASIPELWQQFPGLDAILLNFIVKGLVVDLQEPGRLAFVACGHT
jgi:hypothetical protein